MTHLMRLVFFFLLVIAVVLVRVMLLIRVFILVKLISTRMSSWLRGSRIKFSRSYLVLLFIIFVLSLFMSKSTATELSLLFRRWWKWATASRRTRWVSVSVISSLTWISPIEIRTRRWNSRLPWSKTTLPPLLMKIKFRFSSVLLMFWGWRSWSWSWPWNCADLESFSRPTFLLFNFFLVMVDLAAAVVSWWRSSWSWASLKLRNCWSFQELTFLDLCICIHRMIRLMMILWCRS